VVAVVGTVAPGDEVRSVYSWPPDRLPAGEPTRTWYSPLLLVWHQAQSIDATIPCTAARALDGADPQPTIIATARSPQTDGGLAVVRRADEMVVTVGSDEVTRAHLVPPTEAPDGCAYRLQIAGLNWSIEGGPARSSSHGQLTRFAKVTGLFSDFDLRPSNAPRVDITTFPHRVEATPLHTISRLLAALLAVVALILLATTGRQAHKVARRPLLRPALAALGPADAVVGAALVAWWIVAPAFPDDGWVFVRQSNFATSGGFSNYYNGFAANLPNGYWLEWTQHWLVEATNALVFLRIPSLVVLTAIWLLCRWTVARLLASDEGHHAVIWSLSAAFLVQAFAWGMTIRPEPATALLATVVLASVVQFLQTGSNASVALAALVVPFAVTGHHAGIVALAPLIVAIVPLSRWARAWPARAVSAVASSVALILTLLLLGTDLRNWRTEVAVSHSFGSTGETWLDELNRYSRLTQDLYGTPLRRASVALMGLAMLAFLLRRRRGDGGLTDLPSACLGIGLALLILAPSKWPWHFGALIGLAAVAMAAEVGRIRREMRDANRWHGWPFVAVAATTLAAAWSWHLLSRWNTLDLRSPPWFSAFGPEIPASTVGVLLPILLLVSTGIWQLGRDGSRLETFPWRAASWLPLALALPLVAFTLAGLVWDTATTSVWTLARQNLGALAGRHECGLADDLLRPVRADATTLTMPDLVTYLPCSRVPRLEHGAVLPPVHVVTSDIWVGTGRATSLFDGLYSTSPFAGIDDLYDVQQIPLAESSKPSASILLYRVKPLPGAQLAPPDVRDD
jgi:hypothetical protein